MCTATLCFGAKAIIAEYSLHQKSFFLFQVDKKEQKTADNKRKRRSTVDDEELDLESMDWWSKYFVSMDTLISVSITFVFSSCCSSFRK